MKFAEWKTSDARMAALLAIEKKRPPVDGTVQDAIGSKLAATIGASFSDATPKVDLESDAASEMAAPRATDVSAPRAGLWAKPATVVISFCMGAVTALGAQRYYGAQNSVSARAEASAQAVPPTDTAQREPSIPPTPTGATATGSDKTAPESPTAPPRVSAERTAPPRADDGSDSVLAAERALLDIARTSLSRGDTSHAAEALFKHLKSYPNGRMTEEREALWIQLELTRGDLGTAKKRFSSFRKRYPTSPLVPALEPQLGD